MRVGLKGINTVRKRLADGTTRIYYYAWKGGPRLEGKPGSVEFHTSYAEARSQLRIQPKDILGSVFDEFRQSPDFKALAPRTQKDYAKLLLTLEREFGDLPLLALEDRRTRGDILSWRDRLAVSSRRQADYAYAVLARTLSWALNRGLISVNPCERGGRVYRATRSDRVWTPAHEKAFHAAAPAHLRSALTLALWTGQRQGDLLRLRWKNIDNGLIRIRQSKSGVTVVIPVAEALQLELQRILSNVSDKNNAAFADSPVLLTRRGQPWTESGFRASWRKACIQAGITGLSFHDLRGTAVTRLAQAGCTVPEIATITGHSLKDVGSILDKHYLNRSSDLAVSAMQKLERFHRDI